MIMSCYECICVPMRAHACPATPPTRGVCDPASPARHTTASLHPSPTHQRSPHPPCLLQAPHLTQLSLHCICPENASFFAHLSTATQLRNLAIAHSLTDDEPFTDGNEAAVQLLSSAFSRLTALTALDLLGVCPDSVPEGIGALAALQVRRGCCGWVCERVHWWIPVFECALNWMHLG